MKVDLVGGYYDSGDHVKFGLPMAYSITMLSWGCVEFQKEIAASNQLQHALDAIKWGTDYFMKAHTQPHVLWGQVINRLKILAIVLHLISNDRIYEYMLYNVSFEIIVLHNKFLITPTHLLFGLSLFSLSCFLRKKYA